MCVRGSVFCTCNILSWYYLSRLPKIHLYYIVLQYSVSICLNTNNRRPCSLSLSLFLSLSLPPSLSLSPFLSIYVSLWLQDTCHMMPFTKQHSAYAWVVTCILFLINLTFHNLPLHSSYKIHQPFTDFFTTTILRAAWKTSFSLSGQPSSSFILGHFYIMEKPMVNKGAIGWPYFRKPHVCCRSSIELYRAGIDWLTSFKRWSPSLWKLMLQWLIPWLSSRKTIWNQHLESLELLNPWGLWKMLASMEHKSEAGVAKRLLDLVPVGGMEIEIWQSVTMGFNTKPPWLR